MGTLGSKGLEHQAHREKVAAIKVDQAVFAHVRDGKIAELWEIIDTAVLREQLGEALR